MGPFGVFGRSLRDLLRGAREAPLTPESRTPSQLLEQASSPLRIFFEESEPSLSPREEFYAKMNRVKLAIEKAKLYGQPPE